MSYNAEYYREYYKKHKDRIQNNLRSWRKSNIEKHRAYNRKWWKDNPVKAYRSRANFYAKNPGISKVYSENRRARIEQAGGCFTKSEWDNLRELFGYTCPKCMKQEPEIHLAVDHKIPISKGGTNNIDNIQPLCKRCNSSKGTTIWFASCSLKIAAQ